LYVIHPRTTGLVYCLRTLRTFQGLDAAIGAPSPSDHLCPNHKQRLNLCTKDLNVLEDFWGLFAFLGHIRTT
jgi:hypothetical protein